MGQRVSIKDIARHVGVAASTVSRVLNNVEMVYPPSAATQKKIFAAVEALNYTPNINAKRLSQNKSYAIAMVIPTMDNLLERYTVFEDFSFMEAMQGIEQALYPSQYRLTLIFLNQRYLKQKEYLRLFNERTIDGMIIWGAMCKDNYLDELSGLPVVQLNSHVIPECGVVSEIDHCQGAYLTGNALLESGRRRILYIAGKEDVSVTHDHHRGYRKALEAHGLTENVALLRHGSFDPHCTEPIIDEVLEKKLKFDAVFCVNDNLARSCRHRLQEKAPELASQLIFGGGGLAANPIEHEKYADIYSYCCNYAEMGRQGMNMLLQWLATGSSGENIKIPTSLAFYKPKFS